ncbi:MAG: lyase family protein [bacterium]|nr:lyase family protein [bacterium]
MPVPSGAYYGVHALRARANFPGLGGPVHPQLIRAMAEVKRAGIRASLEEGRLDRGRAWALDRAAAEVATGHHGESFIVDALQGGAGTSSHLNLNEVLANRACELLGSRPGDYRLVHPVDHAGLDQSTNDVFPTALRVAAMRLAHRVVESLAGLAAALGEKEIEFAGVLKPARTELQAAVPVSLGREFGAFARVTGRDRDRVAAAAGWLGRVNLGGTAVGTGLGAAPGHRRRSLAALCSLTGLPLAGVEDPVDGTQNVDAFLELSSSLKLAAADLAKIAQDLRLLSCPGFGEIELPPLQAGSSIMPGKVNPVMTEMMAQVAYQVIGADLAVTLGAQAGQLELNAMLPLIAHNLLGALDLMAAGVEAFTDRCVRGIRADAGRCAQLLRASRDDLQATLAAAHIGYAAASRMAGSDQTV